MSLPNIDYPPFYSHVLIIHIRKQSIKNVHILAEPESILTRKARQQFFHLFTGNVTR